MLRIPFLRQFLLKDTSSGFQPPQVGGAGPVTLMSRSSAAPGARDPSSPGLKGRSRSRRCFPTGRRTHASDYRCTKSPSRFRVCLLWVWGNFRHLFRPAGMGLRLEEGWKWSRALLTGGEARCEISHGQTSESCGVPRRRGTEKMKRGGGE